jgi:preprotein translocase subunit SecE
VADAEKRDAGESTPSTDRRPGDGPADVEAQDLDGAQYELGDIAGSDVVAPELTDDQPVPAEDADAVPEREPSNDELEALTGEDVMAAEAEEAARHGEPAGDDGGPAIDDGELVGVAARTRRDRTARSREAGQVEKPGVEKKGMPTARQRPGGRTEKRTGPVTFVKESVAELRKVVYPTGPQLVNYFVVVLIFVLFIIAFVSLLDLAFGWLILRVFS